MRIEMKFSGKWFVLKGVKRETDSLFPSGLTSDSFSSNWLQVFFSYAFFFSLLTKLWFSFSSLSPAHRWRDEPVPALRDSLFAPLSEKEKKDWINKWCAVTRCSFLPGSKLQQQQYQVSLSNQSIINKQKWGPTIILLLFLSSLSPPLLSSLSPSPKPFHTTFLHLM